MISISQPTSGTKTGLVIGVTSTTTSAFDTDYNNIYVPGGNVAMKGTTGPTFYATLTDWQNASTQDANSSVSDPMITNVAQPIPTNLALDNTGLSIAGYAGDILGNIRSSTPDMGAYEFIANGIVQTSNSSVVSVFPNPVSDVMNIKLDVKNNSSVEFSVYSQDGKLIRNIISTEMQGASATSVDMHDLSDGLYFIRVISGEEIYQGRFIKLSK